jgi:hypothetical protein
MLSILLLRHVRWKKQEQQGNVLSIHKQTGDFAMEKKQQQ